MGDPILLQAVLTLNLLRTTRLHPHMSAAAHLHGPFDYNNTLVAPPGTKIIGHKSPNQRHMWEPPGKHGYLLGLAMYHYHFQQYYITLQSSMWGCTMHIIICAMH
jgi:hypothetical protein